MSVKFYIVREAGKTYDVPLVSTSRRKLFYKLKQKRIAVHPRAARVIKKYSDEHKKMLEVICDTVPEEWNNGTLAEQLAYELIGEYVMECLKVINREVSE